MKIRNIWDWIPRHLLTIEDASNIGGAGGGADAGGGSGGVSGGEGQPDSGSGAEGAGAENAGTQGGQEQGAQGTQGGDQTNAEQGQVAPDLATLQTEVETYKTKVGELEPKLAEHEARLTSAIVIDDPTPEAAKNWNWRGEMQKIPPAHYTQLAYGLSATHLPDFLPHILEQGMNRYSQEQAGQILDSMTGYLARNFGLSVEEFNSRMDAIAEGGNQPGHNGNAAGNGNGNTPSLVNKLREEGASEEVIALAQAQEQSFDRRFRALEGKLTQYDTRLGETNKQQQDRQKQELDNAHEAERGKVWDTALSKYKPAPEDQDLLESARYTAERRIDNDPAAKGALAKARNWLAAGNKARADIEMATYHNRVATILGEVAPRVLRLPAQVSKLQGQVNDKHAAKTEVTGAAAGVAAGADQVAAAIIQKHRDSGDSDWMLNATRELEQRRRGTA